MDLKGALGDIMKKRVEEKEKEEEQEDPAIKEAKKV